MAIENRRQTRKEYSFRSVGNTKRDSQNTIEKKERPPIGIKTPIQLSNKDGLFEMHRDVADQISDNLRNLILTNHGERLGFYDFGANIRPLVLVFLVVSTVLMIFIDAGTISFVVEDKWTDLLQLVLITVIGAYFGGRSLEKVKK